MAKTFANERGDSGQCPERGGVAKGFLRSGLQVSGQLHPIQRLEASLPSGPTGMFKRRFATLPPRLMPATGRLVANTKPPGHLGFGAALLEQVDGLDATLFQRRKVSFYTFWITHMNLDAKRVIQITILCNRQ